jgi:hypothetical protein
LKWFGRRTEEGEGAGIADPGHEITRRVCDRDYPMVDTLDHTAARGFGQDR